MSLRRSLAMTRHEVRILFRNPLPFGILIAMPLLVIAFARPIYQSVASGQGYRGTTGAEYAVSGFGVMFAFFLVGNVGLTFFREYGWLTWDRLRVTSARPSEIVVGKIVPLVSLAVVQQLTLWTAGGVLFDLHVRGPLTALALVALALSSCVVAFGCAVVALAKSMIQVSIVQGLGSMLFAGLGGAITPTALLPPWARAVSPATPTYWAVGAYRSVVLDGAGITDIGKPVLVLIAMALGLTAMAVWRFRVDETKLAW